MSKKQIGECKWFNSKKGFGFITPKDGSEEVFVHQSAIHAEGFRSLAEKEIVEYDVAQDENGRPKAINVTGPNGGFVKGAPKPRARYYGKNRGENGDGDNGSAAAAGGQQQAPRPPRKPRTKDNGAGAAAGGSRNAQQ